MKEHLNKALFAIRSLGMVVIRTGRNKGLSADYATYADIWAMLKEPLAEQALTVGFLPGKTRKEGDAYIQEMTLTCAHESGDSESVAFEILMPAKNAGTNLTQCQGMSHTYGKRYALINYFNLIVGDDDDAERLGFEVSDGMTEAAPDAGAHWRQFCFCPLFNLGDEENKGGWGILSQPHNANAMLGDLKPAEIAKLWPRYPEHAGINAWRAELINQRASDGGIQNWEDCVLTFKNLRLPATFAECNGEQLNNLALALAPKTR